MWLRTLGGLVLAVVIAALLFPAVFIRTGGGHRRTETKTAVVSLTAALKAYYTEYGKWPEFTGDGLFPDEKRQGQLVRMLCGKDEANTPAKPSAPALAKPPKNHAVLLNGVPGAFATGTQ